MRSPRRRLEGGWRESQVIWSAGLLLQRYGWPCSPCVRTASVPLSLLRWEVLLSAWWSLVLESLVGVSWRQRWILLQRGIVSAVSKSVGVTSVDHLKPDVRTEVPWQTQICFPRVKICVKDRTLQGLFSLHIFFYFSCSLLPRLFSLYFPRVRGSGTWERFIFQLPWR